MGIPFVVDRTNTDEEYTRNFIRHSVAPLLKKINPAAAEATLRAGMTLRADEDFIRGLAKDAVGEYLPKDGLRGSVEIPRSVLKELAPSVLSRAIIMTVAAVTDIAVSAAQVQTCRKLITDSGTGTVSLPDKVTLEVSKNSVTVTRALRTAGEFLFDIDLPKHGECLRYSCPEGGFDLYLARRESDIVPDAENIYKLSMNTAVRFDTIYGRVFVRTRLPGDTLFLGGHTRKLKKMICDRGIPESRRDRLPVICDDDGVLLVPGLPVRGPAYARECDMDENVLHVLYCLYEHF
jgi:tRNA(Ile)-lysidine synthase